MFKNLFRRAKPAPVETSVPTTPEPNTMPAPLAVTPKGSSLDAFREGWEDKWETAHEVIEGNGGDTDWGAWTDAVKEEENAFAPTVPMPLGPK